MAEKTKTALNVAYRETLGKKVRALRRSGFIPANIYGNKLDSVAVQVPTDEMKRLMKGHGRTEVIYVQLDGEERPTFIKNVQQNPVTDEVLHIDFHQISLKDKVKLEVPIHFVGVSPAVDTYGALLIHDLNYVMVEALPTNIPSSIEVDVSGLAEVGQALHVSDLVAPADSAIIHDPEVTVARVELPAAEKSEVGEEVEEGVSEVPATPAEAAEEESAEPESE
jgi:large subunit ribosomal protein L25